MSNIVLKLGLTAVLAAVMFTGEAHARPPEGSNTGCIDPNSHVVHDRTQDGGYRCDCNAGYTGTRGGPYGSQCVAAGGAVTPPRTPIVGDKPPRILDYRLGECRTCRARKTACKNAANKRLSQCLKVQAPAAARDQCEQGIKLVDGPGPAFEMVTVTDENACLHWEELCEPVTETCIPMEPPVGGGESKVRCVKRKPRCTPSCTAYGTKQVPKANPQCIATWLNGDRDVVTGTTITINAGGIGANVAISQVKGLNGACNTQATKDLWTCNGEEYDCAEACGQ